MKNAFEMENQDPMQQMQEMAKQMAQQMQDMMQMPMMQMPMMQMMAGMTCEMTKDGMVIKVAPMGGVTMEMIKVCCDRMNQMMTMGLPGMVMCGGVPMMMGCSKK